MGNADAIPMLRAALKGGIEALCARSGVATLARTRYRSRALVLAYHNVVPDEGDPRGDRSLHLPRKRFVEQLELLLRTAEVVPLAAILERSATAARRVRVAITFDDAYRGAVNIGVEELARRGLPATIFVAPGFVGGRSYWWDALGAVGGAPITAAFREVALERLRGEDELVRKHARLHGYDERVPDGYARAASESELRRACGVPGITLGSHSWSHPNLTRLSAPELRYELTEPLRWLRERFDAVVPWLAYPYGLSSEAVARVAAETGYVAALRVAGGWLPAEALNRYALPRFNVPAGLSRDGFALRLAGLFAGGGG